MQAPTRKRTILTVVNANKKQILIQLKIHQTILICGKLFYLHSNCEFVVYELIQI